jgi:hypothetical protein
MSQKLIRILVLATFCIIQSCLDENPSRANEQEEQVSVSIQNATSENIRELVARQTIPEPSYGEVRNFTYSLKIGNTGEFGELEFSVDSLADGEYTYYRNSWSAISVTKFFIRSRYTYTVYQSSSSYYTMDGEFRDIIELAERLDFELGSKYSLVLNDLEGDVDVIEEIE